MKTLLLLPLLLLLPACDSCDELAATAASVTLGTGEASFEELSEGQLLSPVYGMQGGQHVWGAVRLEGLSGGPPGGIYGAGDQNPLVEVTLQDDQGELARYGATYTLTQGSEQPEATGLTVILDLTRYAAPWLWPADVDPERPWDDPAWDQVNADLAAKLMDLRLVASVTDRCGRTGTGEASVGLQGVDARDFSY